jgi:hypothetical protein
LNLLISAGLQNQEVDFDHAVYATCGRKQGLDFINRNFRVFFRLPPAGPELKTFVG